MLGEGQDAYKSIAQMILPFIELAKEVGLTEKNSPEERKTRKRDS
ncbi:MAG: hypothetical protein ACTSR2_10545 [Candidatus Hodarchaeales archaeon]